MVRLIDDQTTTHAFPTPVADRNRRRCNDLRCAVGEGPVRALTTGQSLRGSRAQGSADMSAGRARLQLSCVTLDFSLARRHLPVTTGR